MKKFCSPLELDWNCNLSIMTGGEGVFQTGPKHHAALDIVFI